MKTVSDATFDIDVLAASGLVLVDFWSDGCGPCKQLAVVLDQLSGQWGDKIAVHKMNIMEHPNAAAKYGVRGVPTILLFKDGQVLASKTGAIQKSKLDEWVGSVL